jgi:hypothetical protein
MKKLSAILLSLSISMTLVTPSFAKTVDEPPSYIIVPPTHDPGEAGSYGAPLPDLAGLSEFNDISDIDLLARLIYSEAEDQIYKGKAAVAHIVWNRVAIGRSEFGGSNWKSVMLHTDRDGNPDFLGLRRYEARNPNLSSTAWQDSLDIAMRLSSVENPIRKCLWFATIDTYNLNVKNGMYSFPGGGTYSITDAVQIDDHIFFTVQGYNF